MASNTGNGPVSFYDFTYHLDEELIHAIKIEKLAEKDTYRGTEEYQKFIDSCEDVLQEIAKEYAFQLERGEETGKYHLQGRLKLKTKTRMTTLVNYFKVAGVQCWKQWEVRGLLKGIHLSRTSSAGKGDNFYVTKVETRVDGPWIFPRAAVGGEDDKYVPRQFRMDMDRPFQRSIYAMSKDWDPRTIYCIINFRGNVGKSTLVGWMASQGESVFLPPLNDFKDVSQFICSQVEARGRDVVKNIFIDFPRSIRQDKVYQFFAGIENLKNGIVFDTRYKGRTVMFDSPNIFIFMNTVPILEYMSVDRWNFFAVSPNYELFRAGDGMKQEGIAQFVNDVEEFGRNHGTLWTQELERGLWQYVVPEQKKVEDSFDDIFDVVDDQCHTCGQMVNIKENKYCVCVTENTEESHIFKCPGCKKGCNILFSEIPEDIFITEQEDLEFRVQSRNKDGLLCFDCHTEKFPWDKCTCEYCHRPWRAYAHICHKRACKDCTDKHMEEVEENIKELASHAEPKKVLQIHNDDEFEAFLTEKHFGDVPVPQRIRDEEFEAFLTEEAKKPGSSTDPSDLFE